MERRGYTRPIQGGGDGIGFKTPRQILEVEPQRAASISREMLLRAESLESGQDSTLAGSLSNQEDSINGSQRQLIWKRELEYRLFLLRQRREEHNMAKVTNIPVNNHNEITNETAIPNTFLSIASQERRDRSLQFGSWPGPSLFHSSASRNSSPNIFVKFIPGLPKTVERAIELWRRGSESDGYKAIRLYEKVEMRRILIPNYENKIWAKSGQKNSFFRFKAIAELVSEFGSVLIRLDCTGKDELWQAAIQGFHAHFDRNGTPMALSTVLRQSKST